MLDQHCERVMLELDRPCWRRPVQKAKPAEEQVRCDAALPRLFGAGPEDERALARRP